jgi:VanZ family protein
VLIRTHLFRLLQRLSLVAVIFMVVMIFGLGDSKLATSTFSLTPPLDKLLHASVYGLMAGLLRFSGLLKHGLLVFIVMLGIGALDEWHQIAIPGRQASLYDLLADALGVVIGIWVMDRCRRFIKVQGEG